MMTTTPHHDPQTVARDYLRIWNEADYTRRAAALNSQWTETVTYVDPLMRGQTPAGIADMIEAARGQFSGYSFILRGTPDGHGNTVRFSWDLIGIDGARAAAGTDIVKLAPDGRLAEVIGFLD